MAKLMKTRHRRSCAPWVNPGLFISFIMTILVALLDLALGAATIYWCYYPIIEFEEIRQMFHALPIFQNLTYKDDVLWWGVISIPTFAFFGILSGLNQLYCLCKRITESPHYWKFLIFLTGEVLGFVLPFFLITEYELKVRHVLMLSVKNEYEVFTLLLVKPITIALLFYQILSFLVVYNHNRLNEKLKKLKERELSAVGSFDVERQSDTPNPYQPQYPPLTQLMKELSDLPQYSVTKSSRACSIFVPENGDTVAETSMSLLNDKNHLWNTEISRFARLKGAILSKGEYYEDLEFPASMSSLGMRTRVEWKRPFEINKKAKFFTEGITRFDVKQGELGDCWFLAALANLTLNEELFSNVVPFDNEWGSNNGIYAGMCRFRFYKDGRWEDVIIDDRLPTRDGELIFMHSSDKTEFWSALIEKAYAKLYGSYQNLDGNDGIGPAMLNLTGGTVTRHKISEYRNDLMKLFKLIETALAKENMVGCCRNGYKDRLGIVGGHAYSITKAEQIQFKNGKKLHPCIRIRNPWGSDFEWKGQFSDGHPAWELVDKKMKKELKLKFEGDGEFWFPLHELVAYFHHVEICEVN